MPGVTINLVARFVPLSMSDTTRCHAELYLAGLMFLRAPKHRAEIIRISAPYDRVPTAVLINKLFHT